MIGTRRPAHILGHFYDLNSLIPPLNSVVLGNLGNDGSKSIPSEERTRSCLLRKKWEY